MAGAAARGQRKDLEDKGDALTGVREGIEALKKEQEEATEIERLWHESGGAALEARAEQLEAIQGELENSISTWSDYQDAETGALDPGAYIAGMTARRESISNFNENVQTISKQFGLSQEETQAILDQGLDFAPGLQSIIDSGMSAAYATEIQAAVSGGQAVIDGTPITSTVTADADTSKAEGKLETAAEDRKTKIDATTDTKAVAADLDAVAAKTRNAKITASIDLAAAERSLTEFMNRSRTITITAKAVDREGRPVP
jgi:hypothetical protein